MSYFLTQPPVSLFKTYSGFDTEKQFPGEDNLNSASNTPFPEEAMVRFHGSLNDENIPSLIKLVVLDFCTNIAKFYM